MAPSKAGQRPSKRPRLSSPSESSEVDDADLLAQLNSHCAALIGSALPAPLAAARAPSDESQEEDANEWHGIVGSGDDEDDADSLDDGEDLNDASGANVLVFNDPSKPHDDAAAANVDFKSFMSARIVNQLGKKPANGIKPSRKEQEEDEEEKQLKELDISLATLIKEIPADPDGFGSSLAPRRNHTAPIQRNTPLPLRKGIERARLKRAKVDAEADRVSGAVRAGGSGKDGPALTKKAMRAASGAEDRRRREARGIGGVVGRMGPGGSMLRLSADEVRRGNAGKGVDMLVRARKAGGSEGRKRTYGGGRAK